MAETIAAIPFTQFLRPNGQRRSVTIIRPAPVLEKALVLLNSGYRFECEELATGQVSLTIADDEGDVAIEVVSNAPGVVADAVDRLIAQFDFVAPREAA